MGTIYIAGKNLENLKEFIDGNLVDSLLIEEEGYSIIGSKNFPFPTYLPFRINTFRFFNNGQQFNEETVKLYKNHSQSKLAEFCRKSLLNGGFSIARIPVSTESKNFIKNILKNANIPYVLIGSLNGEKGKEELLPKYDLQKKYDFYSEKIQGIQKENKGKIPEKGTPQLEKRKKYILKMKDMEKSAKQIDFKLK